MPSDKPRVQIRFDEEDWNILEEWAGGEFITIPQLCKAIILRAIASRKKPESSPKDKGKEDK